MAPLIHLIYASTATTEPSEADLADILSASRRNNARRDITGMLLYAAGSFFQVLEGPADAVDAAFGAIACDPRHERAVIIARERIARRAFGAWSMGYATATTPEAEDLLGATDFLGGGAGAAGPAPGRAKKLLDSFRDGRWRARLDAPNLGPGAERRGAVHA